MVQEYGRYFGMKTACLPRRLPDRPGALRRGAARLPRLPDEMRGHRQAVHGLRLQGQAGPRQHPLATTSSPRSGSSSRRRAPATSTTSAAAASRNCSMLEAIGICEEIAGRPLNWTLSGGQPHRRPYLVDQRRRASSSPTIRTGASDTTCAGSWKTFTKAAASVSRRSDSTVGGGVTQAPSGTPSGYAWLSGSGTISAVR